MFTMPTTTTERIDAGSDAIPGLGLLFPIEQLQALAGCSWRELQTILRVSWSTLNSMRQRGLDIYQADRCAMRCGWLPMEVWPEWGHDLASEPEGEDLAACA